MSLLDLFSPPKPPKPDHVSRVHVFMREPPAHLSRDRLTHEEYAKREKERKKLWAQKYREEKA